MANETAGDHLSVHIDEEMANQTDDNLLAHNGGEIPLANERNDHLSHNSGENEMDIEILDDHLSISGGDNTVANEIDDHLSLRGGDTAMANDIDDRLSIRIGKKLVAPYPIWSGRSILKVPKHLRDVNERAYEPQVIAIGPYHRGKSHLMAMEEYKKLYLKMLLQRRNETDVKRYVKAIRALEERARNCYGDFVDLGTDEFVEMMLLDSCFIVELARCGEDNIIKETWILSPVFRDLLLVENQLPFFVLQEFFDMTLTPNERLHFQESIGMPLTPNEQLGFQEFLERLYFQEFIEQLHFPYLCYALFSSVLPTRSLDIGKLLTLINATQNIKHLVGFLHDVWCPSRLISKDKWELICCATELKETGIKFEKVEDDSLFDITFKDGVMKIPRLEIVDKTETIFRNLIAYEQFFLDESLNYVTDYISFMDCLINSPKDVELLCQRGIIDNWLGDEEVVANMFNRLGDFVTISPKNFYYAKLFNDVSDHYGRRCNKRMANLRHNYFNTPWALISFLAAALLLLFTLMQTVFSFLAYFK